MKIKKILISALCIVGTILVVTMPMSAIIYDYPMGFEALPPLSIEIGDYGFSAPTYTPSGYGTYKSTTEEGNLTRWYNMHFEAVPFNELDPFVEPENCTAYSFDVGNLMAGEDGYTVKFYLKNYIFGNPPMLYFYLTENDDAPVGMSCTYNIYLKYRQYNNEVTTRTYNGEYSYSVSDTEPFLNLADYLPGESVCIDEMVITITSESFFNQEGRIGVITKSDVLSGAMNYTAGAIQSGKNDAYEEFDGEINLMDGLVNGIVSIFEAEIFGGITIGNLFLVALAIIIVKTALRFFAGG